MKPTRKEIETAWFTAEGARRGFDAIMEVIDRAWEAEEWRALEAFRKYGQHLPTCARELPSAIAPNLYACDCGYSGALDTLNVADLPSVDEVVGILSEARLADDLERFNELQRARREGYTECLTRLNGVREHSAKEAAERYPLKKRVPKVIPDPHTKERRWRLKDGAFQWSDPDILDGAWGINGMGGVSLGPTPARVRALAELLNDPWTYEDDTSEEDVST